MWNFIVYLVCMMFGAGIGVFAVSLCVAASDKDEIIRRGRKRWWS